MEKNNFAAGFQREGEITFPTETTTEETGTDSQSGKDTKKEDTQSDEGGTNTHKEQDTPFHEHPRWKQREDEWSKRFNEQEKCHQEDLKSIREEFGQARKENAEQTKIPTWFGGTQEQWDAYRADHDAELKRAADQAIEKLKNERSNEDRAVKEATEYFTSEVQFIQNDKELNPTSIKIDTEKLLKTAVDNQLIDTKGRWNYRAAFKILYAGTNQTPSPKPKNDEKKIIASASTENKGGGGGSDKESSVATSLTFKNNRPW